MPTDLNQVLLIYNCINNILIIICNILVSGLVFGFVFCSCGGDFGGNPNHFEPLFWNASENQELFFVSMEDHKASTAFYGDVVFSDNQKPEICLALAAAAESAAHGTIAIADEVAPRVDSAPLAIFDHTNIGLLQTRENVLSITASSRSKKCMNILESGNFVNHNQALGLKMPGKAEEWSSVLSMSTNFLVDEKGGLKVYHQCKTERPDLCSKKKELFFGHNNLLCRHPAYYKKDLISKINYFLYFCY
jgi:hypothetical protein